MYYKKISISTSTILPAAFFAAISAMALVVSFMAASYLYARSTLIPYGVLLALTFILLELLVVVYFSTLSEFGNYLFRKGENRATAISASNEVEQEKAIPSKNEEANPAIVVQNNVISEESAQGKPVPQKTTEVLSAPEAQPIISKVSVERDESITRLLNLSAEENRRKREKFIQGRKELLEAYIRGVMKPLLDEKDIDALWLEFEGWIEQSTYHPKSRMWKWKEKVTSRDVRHLVWNIAKRMGMGTVEGYGISACGRFVKMMFPELCIKKDNSPCSDEYLARNMKESSDSDIIKIDEPDPNSIAFHI